MAITIHQQPQIFSLSDNDILYVFSSNQTAQPNFEYRIEIRINGVLQFVGKVFPIQGATAYFNATEILRGLVPAPTINSQPDTSVNLDPLFFGNSSNRLVNFRVIERFGDPIANGAQAEHNARVWKGACSELQYISLNTEMYTIGATVDRLFLTNFPRSHKYYIDINKNIYLSFINQSNESIILAWTSEDDNDLYTFGTFASNVYFFNLNTNAITNSLGTNWGKFATIQVVELDGGQTTPRNELFRFEFAECLDDDRTVYFLNKLGGVDQWLFTKRKQVKSNFERSEFKKKFGVLDGNSYNYDSFIGRGQNFHNAQTETMVLDSDWLHPDVHAWLVQELLESPLVWMEDNEGNKTRYMIQNSMSDQGQEKYDVWKTLSLEMKPTLQSYSSTL